VLTWLLACSLPEQPKRAAPRAPRAAVPAEVEDDDPPEGPNREPAIYRMAIAPRLPTVATPLTAEVTAKDPEGDEVALSFEWYVDGERLVARDKATLETPDFARGSRVKFTVTARDPGGAFAVSESPEVEVGNADPVIANDPARLGRLDGLLLEAVDADGDEVSWRIEGAPQGVTLDRRGRLSVKGTTTEAGGHYDMKLVAEDGHGGSATLEIPLDVSPGSSAQPRPAPR
jgi:hypothetical protein